MTFPGDRVLGYASPDPGVGERRRRRLHFFAFGAALGVIVAGVLEVVLMAGGPIFPMTFLFSPVAVVCEWVRTDAVFIIGLYAGGPVLYGLYATLLVLPKRRRNLPLAAGVHLACFAVTLWQRDVWSLL